MSNIKLAPNAAGTANFTIAAPGTSTDRTQTLPNVSGTFVVDQNGSAVTINTAGNVGLGVTPSAWGSGYRAIELGAGAALTYDTALVRTYLTNNIYQNGTAWTLNSGINGAYYEVRPDTHNWYGWGDTDSSPSLWMSLTQNGPSLGALTVTGTISATTSITTPLITRAGTLALAATGANIITASTNANERVRIHASGGVSIGNTTDPGATNLSVTGSVLVGSEIYQTQLTPIAKTASATLTIAELLTNIITVTSATAVALTLPTGTLTDAGVLGGTAANNTSFDWSVINLGSSSGAVTMTAATGHTYVGSATVAISTSARFRTRKTATNTYVTYRI